MEIKATGDGVGYVSKSPYEWEGKSYEPDIKPEDRVTIKDGGTVESGQFGDQFYFKVETRNGVKKAPFNQTTINILVENFGDESEHWVGKQVKVLMTRDIINNKKVMPTYYVPENYIVDEWGAIVKDEPDTPRDAILTPKTDAQKKVDELRNQEVPDSQF